MPPFCPIDYQAALSLDARCTNQIGIGEIVILNHNQPPVKPLIPEWPQALKNARHTTTETSCSTASEPTLNG